MADPFAPRQIRRCVMPLQPLVEYIDRRTNELKNARIHHAVADERLNRLTLYIETECEPDAPPRPVDFELDWNEIFGVIPCEVTGEPTPVEEITVSRRAAKMMMDRIAELEKIVYGDSD